MFRLAAQGNSKAQRQLIDLIARSESNRAALMSSYLDQAIKYKLEAEEVIKQRESQGLPPPDFYPHPDDIIIDLHAGEVVVDGPWTEEQAGAQEAFYKLAIKKLRRLFEVESALEKDPGNKALKKEMKDLDIYKDFFARCAGRRSRLEALQQSREALRLAKAQAKKSNVESKA